MRKGHSETLSVPCLSRVASVGGKGVGDLLHLEPAFLVGQAGEMHLGLTVV